MGKRLGDFGKDHGDPRLYWQRTPCLGLNLRVPLPSSCAEFHILRGTRRWEKRKTPRWRVLEQWIQKNAETTDAATYRLLAQSAFSVAPSAPTIALPTRIRPRPHNSPLHHSRSQQTLPSTTETQKAARPPPSTLAFLGGSRRRPSYLQETTT